MPSAWQSRSLIERISPQLVPSHLHALDQWIVSQHLGSGTSADVWLLENKLDRRQVACKTPRTAEGAAGLSQEAELATRLSHENLVRSIMVDAKDQLSSIKPDNASFWEYLAGGTLSGLIAATDHLSVAQTVTVVLPLVQVTQYLHAQGIVHGDISPRNIMFDLTGRPVLIDLGSACATGYTGTPGFIAPEALTAGRQLHSFAPSGDSYALAAVAWFCLTGTVPGSAAHRVPLTTIRPGLESEIVEVLEECLNAEPTRRPHLDRLLESIVQWAEPEPVDLYASVGEDYGLLLPTRKPAPAPPTRSRFRFRKAPKRTRAAISTPHTPSDRTRSRTRQRMLLTLSTFGLIVGAAFTYVYASELAPVASGTSGAAVETLHQLRVQSVLDGLVATRSTAWATATPELVASYAAVDSPVFHADTELLTTLAKAGQRLEGLRMHAVIHEVEESAGVTVARVRWKTEEYVQLDERDRVIHEVQAQEELVDLEIAEGPDGWRIVTVR